MNSNVEHLEKAFFAYILENPTFFHRVEPIAFKNPSIQFIYTRVHSYYLNSKKPQTPSNKVIYELVRMDDPAKKISDDYIQMLLNYDISEYDQPGSDDEWLKRTLQSWCTHTNVYHRITEAALKIRELNPLDYEGVDKAFNEIRTLVGDSALNSYGDDDLGIDFDDPDSHIQDTKANKISTGWNTLDELLAGGWDRKTMNVIIGPSNSGKSLWLVNVASNAANSGKNVLYVSLEMSEKKIMKRIGAVRLKININDYDHKSKDINFMQGKLKELRTRGSSQFSDSSDIFQKSLGKLFVKEFPAGSASVADVDAHVKNLQEKKGIKIDMVVVDYLTIMSPDNRANGSLFSNGKQLSEGLRAIGQRYDLCMVTAMQVGKDNFGANDINLSDISESKAIVETADTMFGIIRTDAMRREGKYILKLLKLRDGDFKWEKTHFSLNRDYLSIGDDKKYDGM